MAANRTVKTTLVAEISQYIRAMREAAAATKGVGDGGKKSSDEATSAFGRLLETADRNRSAFETLGGVLVTAGGAVTALGIAALKTGIEYNTLRQTTTAALTSVLGSASAAADQMDRLDEFATSSPFSKQTFITAQQQMLAFGIEAEKVVPYLDSIQNAVAATGGSNAEIAELATIFAKIQGSAKITAEDLNEFGIRGVNAAELIGSQMGKTGAEIRDAISSGSLDAQVALDALSAGMIQNFDGAADGVKNTFTGALDRISAAWRDLGSELAEPLVSADGGGFLVDLANGAADAMRAFQALPGPAKQAIAVTTGVAGAAALAGGALLLALPRIRDTVQAYRDVVPAGSRADKAIRGAGRAAGFAVGTLGALAAAAAVVANAGGEVAQGASEINANLEALGRGARTATTAFKDVEGAFGTTHREGIEFDQLVSDLAEPSRWEAFNGTISDFAVGIGNIFGADWRAAWQQQRDILVEYDGQIAQMATTSLPDAQAAFRQLHKEAGGTSEAGEQLLKVMPELRDSLVGVAQDAGLATNDSTLLQIALGEVEAATDAAADATLDAADALGEYTDALTENIEANREAAGLVLSLRDAQNRAEAAYDSARESLKENGKTLDVTTAKGRENRAALDDIAESGWDLIESMNANGAKQKDLQGTMKSTRDRFIEVAERMGASSKEARELADELGLIPKNVKTDISADASQAKKEGRETRAYLNNLHARISVAAATGSAYAEANALYNYINGLNATISVSGRRVATGRGGTGGITFADGGAVSGPGTATSDSIHARLSNGEHVWTASDVIKAGGQDAVYRLRRAVQAGELRFAKGGAVVKPQGFAAGGAVTGMYAAPSSSRSYDLTFISRGVPSEREVRSAIVSAEALAIPGGEWA